jgi:hypothetical protein
MPLPPLPPYGPRQRRYWAAPSAVPAGRESAARTGRPGKAVYAVQTGRVGTVDMGHADTVQLGRGGFGPVTVDLFFSIFRIYSNPCKFKKIV